MKTLLIFLSLFLINNILAQKLIVNTKFEDVNILKKLIVIPDSSNSTFTLFYKYYKAGENLHGKKIIKNNDVVLSKNYSNNRDILDVITIDDVHRVMNYSNIHEQFYGITFDDINDNHKAYKLNVDTNNENIVTRFVENNIFYVVTSSKKENEVFVYKYKEFSSNEKIKVQFIKNEVNFDNNLGEYKLDEYKSKPLKKYFKDTFFSFIPKKIGNLHQNENYLENCVMSFKSYMIGNDIYLIDDRFYQFSIIIKINTINSIGSINYLFTKLKSYPYKSLSTQIFDNKIFQLFSSNEKCVINIYNLDDYSLKKNHLFYKDSAINFLNGDIYDYFNNKETIDVNKLLRKMDEKPFLSILEKNDSCYELMIGCYKLIQKDPNYLPNTATPGIYFFSNECVPSFCFKTSLRIEDLTYVKKQNTKMKKEICDDFFYSKKINLFSDIDIKDVSLFSKDSVVVYRYTFNNKYYIAYFDENDKHFKIYEF
jgi:hypothetical protein